MDTVTGRLMMTLLSAVGCHTSSTADIQGKIDLGAGKALGGILELEVALGLSRQIPQHDGAVHSDLDDLFLGFAEDLLTLGHRGGVVQVDNGSLTALQGREGLADNVLSCLGEHLDGDVVRDQVLFDQGPQKDIFRFGGRREADFDFLKAHSDQGFEILDFFLQAHGNNECLVAVAQVYRAPDRRLGNILFVHPVSGFDRGHKITAFVFLGVHHNGKFSFFRF